jgi:tartrate-resistant acid phosphatase type 5
MAAMRKRTKDYSLAAAAIAALAMAALFIWLFSFQSTMGLAQWQPTWRRNFILFGVAGILPLLVALIGLPKRRHEAWKPGAAIAIAAFATAFLSVALAAGLFQYVESSSGAARLPRPTLNLIEPAAGIAASEPDGILRLSLLSDPHWGAPTSNPAARIELLEGVAAARPKRDALLLLGDNVEMGMEEASWQQEAKEISAAIGNMPIRSILGNHDGLVGGERLFKDYFSPPSLKTDSGNPFYYSMEAGPVTIVVINLLWGIESFGSDQEAWLEKRLAAVPAGRQVIVLSHCYVYASGYVDEYGYPYYDDPVVIAKIAPILERHKVALMISGHNHDMELLKRNGVTYAVVGAMGGILDPEPSYRSPASLWFKAGTYGRLDLDISEKGIGLAFVDLDGKRLYEARIPKGE